MIKKHDKNTKEINRTDELINDYLQDVFILPVSIQAHCFLVPAIKLLSSNVGSESYSKEQAILILLNALYFLSRPLSPRARQCFVNLAEQMIDDYQFASFKLQMTPQGIFA